MKMARRIAALSLVITVLTFCGCNLNTDQIAPEDTNAKTNSTQDISYTLAEIPEYDGQAYIALENNEPNFSEEDLTEVSFERYSELDSLGRCGVAYANIGIDLMPTENRGSIGQVKPTGWKTVKYDIVDGKYLYNRCHLIGFQLTGENANENNLITGTRYLNIDGMLPFENMVADYVKETKNHVLYRVTPVYDGENLLASGVIMEGYSVEDRGEGICFNVYAYNVQPDIIINYANGDSSLEVLTGDSNINNEAPTGGSNINNEAPTEDSDVNNKGLLGASNTSHKEQAEIRGNSNSKIYHCEGQAAYKEMSDSKYLVIFDTEQEAIESGYRKAKR